MASYPPIDRSYVVSYAANDRDFPVIGIKKDPRVAGYRVPEDLSPHPDSKRYPNHVFTGAQPSSGDQIVTHIYEILPSPWVPFTRYDDDLGPIQGRRRSVKNEGQVASLAADKRVTYEAREGSAIVYTEIEETWSIATDDDGNSLFPVKDRDFYDASRGPVQERRQLFVPTGEEEGSLENVNGVITQTSYEPYNEFLSIKIVQTYKVDGPRLVGFATNNEGQLSTVFTRRKGALNYTPPAPNALRNVEVSREDAESLVERIVTIPSVFEGKSLSAERPDTIPQKFRVRIPTNTEEQSIIGEVQTPTLATTNEVVELSKSEQQVTEFVKRTRTTSRPITTSETIESFQFTQDLGGGIATVTEIYPFTGDNPVPELGLLSDEVEDLGDGTKIRRQVKLPTQSITVGELDESGSPIVVDAMPLLVGQEYDEQLDIVIPYKQIFASPDTTELVSGNRKRVNPRDVAHSQVTRYDVEDVQEELDDYYWEIPDMIDVSFPDKLLSITAAVNGSQAESSSPTVSGDTYSYSQSRRSSVGATISYNIERGFSGVIPTIRAIFFLPKGEASPQNVLSKLRTRRGNSEIEFWPNARPESHQIAIIQTSESEEESNSVSFDSVSTATSTSSSVSTNISTIPATIHGELTIGFTGTIPDGAGSISITPSTLPETNFPIFPTGEYLYRINASPYRFSYVRVDALLIEVTNEYV